MSTVKVNYTQQIADTHTGINQFIIPLHGYLTKLGYRASYVLSRAVVGSSRLKANAEYSIIIFHTIGSRALVIPQHESLLYDYRTTISVDESTLTASTNLHGLLSHIGSNETTNIQEIASLTFDLGKPDTIQELEKYLDNMVVTLQNRVNDQI